MSGKFGATIARSALLTGAILGAAALTTPAFADPIDVLTTVRVGNLAQPTTPQEQAVVRFKIANAAEAACGSDQRSLSEYRQAVRRSQCFRDSYATAMEQLSSRWGSGAGQ
ncbi:UrcA family protein [Sphingomonas sp. BAUL-RG-20F-R05-02]|uniref:UrcA family protein n=1 Tax=Sphingomonas sp. BAUL-RG-20F-R05-02 TaxID=2914830 RepID=UPI001F5A5478|nr:UrcA family protein [Sphingomonas sp. BAUL-RG-20F-R05-02]